MKTPIEYRWLRAHNFKGFTPWYIIEPESSNAIRKEYQIESGKDLYPFARRQDNDDIAGFVIENGVVLPKVLTIHLTWSRKKENNNSFAALNSTDIFDWLTNIVIPITKEWMTEDELSDLV